MDKDLLRIVIIAVGNGLFSVAACTLGFATALEFSVFALTPLCCASCIYSVFKRVLTCESFL
jgi:hypothetical protein